MDTQPNKVVTRFAPSPTGLLHMGNYRTALFSYLYAKQNVGKFILRIEDTDIERSKKEYEENIIESLAWLGLSYEQPIYKQSECSEIHKKYLKKLVEDGFAYVSKEQPKEGGTRTEVIRFKNPNKVVDFTDLIRGEVSMDTTDLKDFVIAKSFDEPLFHLAVVVDDFELGITHIVRGEDHISNTPRQILIQEAIGASRPMYAHLPMVLAPDRTKLSKRKGAKSVSWYKEAGYLPSAILNYMALLGWNPGTPQEIFLLSDLEKIFDISKVQKSGAIFNEEKLQWINKEHMKLLPESELILKLKKILEESTNETVKSKKIPDNDVKKLAPILLERSMTFGDIKNMIDNGDVDYFFADPEYQISNLVWKNKEPSDKAFPDDITSALVRRLQHIIETLKNIDENSFKKDIIKTALWDYATAEGRGEVLWPMRFALSGKEKSPDPFVLAELLGKEVTIGRVSRALEKATHA